MSVFSDSRLWRNLCVRLAVALAFADASIVVLALPQIVDRLHSSISHVVWVIVAYNLALIVAAVATIPVARQIASTRTLVAGLILFGLASIGCGASNSLAALVPLRCVQGVGGALVLVASLPLFAGAARPGDPPEVGWSAAAAIGAAVGPAAGGVLTQIFSWRAIFLAQAPVAAIAVIAVLAVRARPVGELPATIEPRPSALDALSANASLTFLSAGLIGALFLVVIELINAWQIKPIVAAAVVTMIPVATAAAERVVRGRSPVALGAVGSVLLAAGLAGLALISHRQPGWVVLALALSGTGLGLGFTGLTTAALAGRGSAAARAAKTVAARDAGLVLGLLLLTPVFVDQYNAAVSQAQSGVRAQVIFAPIPISLKIQLGNRLEAAARNSPQSSPPDLRSAFAAVNARASPSELVQLVSLEERIEALVQRAATRPFRRPLLYGALLALIVLPLLGFRVLYDRRRGDRAA